MKVHVYLDHDFPWYLVRVTDMNGRELTRSREKSKEVAEAKGLEYIEHYSKLKPIAVPKEEEKNEEKPVFTIKQVTLTMTEMEWMLDSYKRNLYLQKTNKMPAVKEHEWLKNWLMTNIIKG